jgi:glycosyltransferase involved in cell wall biosynthesis
MASQSTSPVRIALLDPSGFSLPYDEALAAGLHEQGCDVTIIGTGGERDPRSPASSVSHFYAACEWPGLRALTGPARQAVKGLCHGIDMIRLDGLLERFRIDILHCQWLPLPVLDHQAVRWLRRKRPVVLTMHDSNPYNGAGSWLMRAGHLALPRAVDAVIVHTAAARERLVANGVEAERLHQLPHGLLNQPVQAPAPRPRSETAPLVLLQFGKIKPYKGVDVLLEALALLSPDQRVRFKVQIVGKPYMDTGGFESFVASRGLAEIVHFRFEFVDDDELRRLMARADAIVLPYREIDASGVAMTAIAQGKPILGTTIDGFRELFGEGGGARLVAPGSAEALADVLRDWAAAPERLQRLAEEMADRRALIPSWGEIGRRTLDVYAEARAGWLDRAAVPRAPSVPVGGGRTPT